MGADVVHFNTIGCLYYPGKKKLRQPCMSNYRRGHARESMRLYPRCMQLSNFFGQGRNSSHCTIHHTVVEQKKKQKKELTLAYIIALHGLCYMNGQRHIRGLSVFNQQYLVVVFHLSVSTQQSSEVLSFKT